MKAMVMTRAGDPDVLGLVDVEKPVPGEHDLLVRIHAAGVNPLDTKVRKLHMYYPDHLPAILGCDGAGVVERVGKSVTRFREGDEVYFFNNGIGADGGTYAEYSLVNEDYAARKPSSVTMTEAAAVPLVLITAWEALIDRVDLKAGETVLIHAGAGGVGHVAIQLARNVGARIATTVSGDEKARFAQRIGAERTIDYKRENFVQQTLEWTNKRGADVVFDTLGGPTFCGSFDAVRLYGKLATLLSTPCDLPQLNRARLRNITVSYVQMTMPLYFGIHEFRCAQTRILEKGAALIDEGKLEVKVSAVLPLVEAVKAHRLLEEGHTFGKVVLAVE